VRADQCRDPSSAPSLLRFSAVCSTRFFTSPPRAHRHRTRRDASHRPRGRCRAWTARRRSANPAPRRPQYPAKLRRAHRRRRERSPVPRLNLEASLAPLSAGKAKRITRRPGATTAASADPQRHRGNWVIITISDALTKGEPRLVELGEATSSARPAGPTRTSGATNRPLGLNASSAARSSPSAAKTTSTPTSASRPRLVEPALTPAPATTSGTSSSPEPAARRVACVDGMQQARSTSGDPASTSLPWWPRREASKRCRRCSMSLPKAQTRPDSANPPTAGSGGCLTHSWDGAQRCP
jgi:hypothetical protein